MRYWVTTALLKLRRGRIRRETLGENRETKARQQTITTRAVFFICNHVCVTFYIDTSTLERNSPSLGHDYLSFRKIATTTKKKTRKRERWRRTNNVPIGPSGERYESQFIVTLPMLRHFSKPKLTPTNATRKQNRYNGKTRNNSFLKGSSHRPNPRSSWPRDCFVSLAERPRWRTTAPCGEDML